MEMEAFEVNDQVILDLVNNGIETLRLEREHEESEREKERLEKITAWEDLVCELRNLLPDFLDPYFIFEIPENPSVKPLAYNNYTANLDIPGLAPVRVHFTRAKNGWHILGYAAAQAIWDGFTVPQFSFKNSSKQLRMLAVAFAQARESYLEYVRFENAFDDYCRNEEEREQKTEPDYIPFEGSHSELVNLINMDELITLIRDVIREERESA